MNIALKLYKIHEKYTKNANMIHTYQRVCLLHDVSILYSFSLHQGFVQLGFTVKVFNEVVIIDQKQSTS